MKILITGARGFVGARLMKELEGAIAAPSIQGGLYFNRTIKLTVLN